MKTKLLYFILLSLIFSACSQDDVFESVSEIDNQNKLKSSYPVLTINWNTEDRYMSNSNVGYVWIKEISLTLNSPVFIDWGDG